MSGENIYITGHFEQTANFNNPSSLGSNEITSAGNTDIFLAKFNNTGTFQWAKRAGGTDGGFSPPYLLGGTMFHSSGNTNISERGCGVAVNGNAVYITGSFLGTANFNTPSSSGTNELTSFYDASDDVYRTDIFVAKYNDEGTLQWAKRAGGIVDDVANGIAVNGTSIYITGQIGGNVNFNTPSAIGTNEIIGTRQDIFIAKYNDSGTFQWAKRVDGDGSDFGIQITTSGSSIYLTGAFGFQNEFTFFDENWTGSIYFDTPHTAENTLIPQGSSDIFVAKYNDDGTFQWARRAGGNSDDISYGIGANSTSVYITGGLKGNTNFNTPSATGTNEINVTNFGTDIFIAKYTEAGILQWAKNAGSQSGNFQPSSGNSLALYNDICYVTGNFVGTNNFSYGTSVNNTKTSNNSDLFLSSILDEENSVPPNINKLEYFVDTDPGYGNGTSIGVVNINNISNLLVDIPANTLTNGNHLLTFRAKDADNQWSINVVRPFYKMEIEPIANIELIEYFVDNDPGYGSGTLVPNSNGNMLSNLPFTVPMDALSIGFHKLIVRAKNTNGQWSVNTTRFFEKTAENTILEIVYLETFVDNDPGYGGGNSITISPTLNIDNLIFEQNANNLSVGFHNLFVRAKNADNQWSSIAIRPFEVKASPTPEQLPGSGNAISFDGVDDHISLGNTFTMQNFTIDMWIKPGATQNQFANIIDNNHSGSFTNWVCQQDDNNVNRYGFGTMNTGAFFTLTANVWQHLTLVKSATTIETYVNGILSQSTAYNAGPINFNGNFLRLGSFGGGGRNWKGQMDEVRIWDTALNQAQIRDRMCKKISNSDALISNLKAYYNFDESTGITVFDGSVNATNGTLINTPTRPISGAPIGNQSAHNYIVAGLPAVNLSYNAQDDLAVNVNSGTYTGEAGTHIYVVNEKPNTQAGINFTGANNRYFGVFNANITSPQYTAVYNYTGNPSVGISENDLLIFKRNDNAATTWENANGILNLTANTFTLAGQNTEYNLGFSANPLPLNLLSFSGKNTEDGNVLTWQTANETNFSHFEIQRSSPLTPGGGITNQKFENISEKKSDESKIYEYIDRTPPLGAGGLYRLKMIDLDGKYSYSKIIFVKNETEFSFTIYPNPVIENLNILANIKEAGNYQIKIMDEIGYVKSSQNSFLNTGQNQISISTNSWQKGLYFAVIQGDMGFNKVLKFLK